MVYKNCSQDLAWQVVRNNSASIRVQRGINKRFSTEAFNLKRVNSPRYNGFINTSGVDVTVNKDKQIVVTTKNSSKARFPAKSTATVAVRATRRALKTAGNNAKATGRTYLKQVAERRTSRLLRSLKKNRGAGAKKDA